MVYLQRRDDCVWRRAKKKETNDTNREMILNATSAECINDERRRRQKLKNKFQLKTKNIWTCVLPLMNCSTCRFDSSLIRLSHKVVNKKPGKQTSECECVKEWNRNEMKLQCRKWSRKHIFGLFILNWAHSVEFFETANNVERQPVQKKAERCDSRTKKNIWDFDWMK